MSDYINKVITLILIFVMLVLGPLTFSYLSDELTSKRMILNEVTKFLDKVTDQASISGSDLDDFYLAINSYGMVLDAKIERYMQTPAVGLDGKTENIYFMANDFRDLGPNDVVNFVPSDVIQVSVEEVAVSPGRRLMYYILRVDTGRYELTMAAAVN